MEQEAASCAFCPTLLEATAGGSGRWQQRPRRTRAERACASREGVRGLCEQRGRPRACASREGVRGLARAEKFSAYALVKRSSDLSPNLSKVEITCHNEPLMPTICLHNVIEQWLQGARLSQRLPAVIGASAKEFVVTLGYRRSKTELEPSALR
ncbi:hypothetical protein ZIOFF_034968 [Zingiber officinale]|uniref:Uncharacterized protein n=1 Tax=Zingiber officinale TaxID=94328 RepID=A0A8J5GLV6_ZINOF|nr:hypothetical protein ZIOFF_034968 [Zingiber officinale]